MRKLGPASAGLHPPRAPGRSSRGTPTDRRAASLDRMPCGTSYGNRTVICLTLHNFMKSVYREPMADSIQTAALVKTFGKTLALDGLDLTVATGEVHGFLGPNGSGKSTTIRILLGLLRADSGEAQLLGGDPWREAVSLHRRVAYVPGDVNLWPNLTGGEAIDLIGSLRGGIDAARRDSLVDRFELDPTKKGRTYSK